MNTIYFYGHNESKYDSQKWRAVFSQFYLKTFKGNPSIYDLSEVINDDLLKKYVYENLFICREQWMMLHKALLFAKDNNVEANIKILEEIKTSKTPSAIKKFGRMIIGFDESIWNEWKYKIVANGNYLQFSQDDKLKKILKSTLNNELVEASPTDRIWGIGFNEKKAQKIDRKLWGQNLLGKALMEVREKI